MGPCEGAMQRVGLAVVLLAVACVRSAEGLTFTSTLGNSSIIYTEQEFPRYVDPGYSLFSDDDTLLGLNGTASLVTTDPFDFLEFEETWYPGTVTKYSYATKKLYVEGTTGYKPYQFWFRSIKFSNNGDNPVTTDRTINLEVCSPTVCVRNSKTITVKPVNDKASFTLSAPFGYTELDGKVYVDANAVIKDVDTPTLTQLEVFLSSGYDSGKDVLSFETDPATIAGAGLTGAWNAAAGKLTVTAATSAPVATFQQVLRTVRRRRKQPPRPAKHHPISQSSISQKDYYNNGAFNMNPVFV